MYMSTALQDDLLDQMVDGAMPVTVYLINGFQLRGVIVDHDDAVILLVTEGKQQMLYKHALSTISPLRPVKVNKEG